MKELTPKIKRFCENYIQNGSNGTEAALEAGYGERGTVKGRHVAAQSASRLLQRENVKAYIRARTKEIFEEIGISPERIAAELWKLYQRSAEGSEILDKEGNSTGVWAYDGKTALGALKALGESQNMFRPKVEVSGSVNLLEGLSDKELSRMLEELEEGEDE